MATYTTVTAHIVRVTGSVAYAADDDQKMDRLAAFPFGKIKGYRGQTAKELGLRAGSKVKLEYDDKNRINLVSL